MDPSLKDALITINQMESEFGTLQIKTKSKAAIHKLRGLILTLIKSSYHGRQHLKSLKPYENEI